MSHVTQSLQDRLKLLEAQHRAVTQQLLGTFDADIRVTLVYKLNNIELEIDEIGGKLQLLSDNSQKLQHLRTISYFDFHLILSEVSDDPNSFDLKFGTYTQYMELGRFPSDILAPLAHRVTNVSQAAQSGKQVYTALNLKDIAHLLDLAYENANNRPRLLISANHKLLNLRWEWLHDGASFWAGKHRMAFVRLLSPTIPPSLPPIPESALRILLTSDCDETNSSLVALKHLADQLTGHIILEPQIKASPNKLFQCLRRAHMDDTPYDVWHHHSTHISPSDVVTFNGKPIHVSDIARITGQHPPFNLFTLWTESDFHAENNFALFANQISTLATLHVPSQTNGQDFLNFIEEFYSLLLFRPVDEALRRAQVTLIRQKPKEIHWSLPSLIIKNKS